MEILNNTNLICCFITFILGAMFMLATLAIASMNKIKEPRNNVHFYVARDKNNDLWLYIGKPIRDDIIFKSDLTKGCIGLIHMNFKYFGLNENDYANLKWEDEPVEVFINMKDN